MMCLFALLLSMASAIPAAPRIGTAHGLTDSLYDYKSDAFFRERPIVREMAREGLELRLYNGPGSDPWGKSLRQFNAIWLMIEHERKVPYDPDEVGEALREYVEAGGGLVIDQSPGRYAQSPVDSYWDKACAHLGMRRLHEEIVDFKDLWRATAFNWAFYVTNFVRHPVTEGVPGLWFPCRGNTQTWGSMAIEYPPPWQVVVRGGETAMSYVKHPGTNNVQYDRVGLYKARAPLVAVRQLGRGRVVSIAVHKDNGGWMYGIDTWPNFCERGAHDGKASDFVRLHENALKWVSEPSLRDPAFAVGFVPVERPPQAYVPTREMDFSRERMSYPSARPAAGIGARGVVGLHSNHSDGRSTVREYAAAAKRLNLNYLVFADPLDRLSPEKVQQLRKDCAAVSDAEFYACPGVEFVDRMGIPWTIFHDRIGFPTRSASLRGRDYTVFDGKRVLQRGHYSGVDNRFNGGVLSQAAFEQTGASWSNQHWFNLLVPYVHENGEVVEDNFRQYLFQSKYLHRCQVSSFTRIRAADELDWAAKKALTCARSLDDVRKILNRNGASAGTAAAAANQFVRYGGDIALPRFEATHVPGTDLLRVDLTVKSSAGVLEVVVRDADRRVLARFLPDGAMTFERTFDFLHDRTCFLILEARDRAGNLVCSVPRWCSYYHGGLMRCNDNMNLLCWRPALINQLHWDGDCVASYKKHFARAGHFHMSEAEGWMKLKTPSRLPTAEPWNYWINIPLKGIDFPGAGHSPSGSTSFTLDAPNFLAIIDQTIGDCRTCASRSPVNLNFHSGCVLAKDGENPYWRHRRRVYQFVDRIDTYWYYTKYEPNPGYRGGYAVTEGEVEFLKDVVLSDPIQLFRLTSTNPNGKVDEYGPSAGVPLSRGAYHALVSNPAEWYGVFGLENGGDVRTSCEGKDGDRTLRLLLGERGGSYPAGTVLRYRFAVGTFAEDPRNGDFVRGFARMLDGSCLPVEMRKGRLSGFDGLIELQAEDFSAEARLGPAEFIQDYPVRVTGLVDNGSAVATNGRKWKPLAMENGKAYIECALEPGDTWWFGNLFVAEDPSLRFTYVPAMPGHRRATVEVFNVTAHDVTTVVRDIRGGRAFTLTIPAGSMIERNCE